MKPEIPDNNDSRLRNLLREWKAEAPLPPRFEDQVWRRIAKADAPSPGPLDLLRSRLARLVVRPAFACGYAAILLIAGLVAGTWQAQANGQRASETLSSRYVQTIDPYQMPHP